MLQKRIYIFYFLVFVSFGSLLGQEFGRDEVKVLKKNEFTVGGSVYSEGISFDLRRSFQKTVDVKRTVSLEFGRLRNIKERKIKPFGSDIGRYVYGRLNTLLISRLSYGNYKILAHKQSSSGVAIQWINHGGLTFGFLKPVYLVVKYASNNIPGAPFIYVEEQFDASKHTIDNIQGQSRFRSGLNEIDLHLGFHYKTGVKFEYSNESSKVSALEAGIAVDGFLKTPEIMAETRNSQFFINLYISAIVGKIW